MDLTTLATDEKYVGITTFRPDGAPRATPVRIADLGEVGFTAGLDGDRMDRIGDNLSVELRESHVRGDMRPHAPAVAGTAREVTVDELERVRDAIRSTYGPMFRVIVLWERAKLLATRESADDTCAVIVSAAA